MIKIRQAEKGDAQRLLWIVDRLAEELNIQPGEFWVKTIEQEEVEIQKYANADNSLFLVALNGEDDIIGSLTLTGRGVASGAPREAEHHVVQLGLSVLPLYRDKGVGTSLLLAAIGWAQRGGIIKRIEVQSYAPNEMARELYKRHGFKIEGCRKNAIKRGDEYIDVYMIALLLDTTDVQ